PRFLHQHQGIAGTGIIPDLVNVGIASGLVKTNAMFRDQEHRDSLPIVNPVGLTQVNQMDPIGSNDLTETDGAPLKILRAEAVDGAETSNNSPSLSGNLLPDGDASGCAITLPKTLIPPVCRDNGDGWIDGYRLTLSEKVDDRSVVPGDWKVDGVPATKLA